MFTRIFWFLVPISWGTSARFPPPADAHAVFLWQGRSRRVGADVWDESTESRSALQPLRTSLAIRPERRTPVVVVRWTDEKNSSFYIKAETKFGA